MQNIFALSGLVNLIISFSFGLFVYLKNRKNIINILFFLITLSFSLWSFAYWRWLSVYDNKDLALFWVKILSIGSTFIPLAFFQWVNELFKLNKKKIIIFFYFLTLFYSFFFFSDLFIKDVVPQLGFSFWPKPGIIYTASLITHYFFILIYSFILLILYYKKVDSTKKSQMKYIFVGAFFAFLGGSTNFFLWYDVKVLPFGNLISSLYVIFFGFAVIKYRLMGIKTIASKIYTYALLGAFSYLFFHIVIYIDNKFLGGVYTPISLLTGVFFAIIFAFIFLPLLDKIQKSSDVLFYRGHNPRSIIKDLALELSMAIEFKELVFILTQEFKKILATEEIDLLLFPNKEVSGDFCLNGVYSFKDADLCISDIICQTVLKDKKIIIRDEIKDKHSALSRELDKHKIKIVSPLIKQEKVIGLILLGEKMAQDAYNQEDIEFLEIISTQAASAVENARLHKEVDDFNKNLQKKVDEQTADIKAKSEHLAKLMAMRSEFLDIASHQLRTPVAVIKGMISMMKEDSVPENKKEFFMNAVLQKSFKLSEIIDEILRASELDSNRFELTLKPINLVELIDDIYKEKKVEAKTKNNELAYAKPEGDFPLVMSDDKYIKHVIMNLVNNSIQYTHEGKIEIKLTQENNSAIVRVIDNGIGIPQEDMPKLFQKFSRAKNAVDTYTDGSGLGLFIIKQIIEYHPGAKIEIERTEVDKGTTFAITLPLAKTA